MIFVFGSNLAGKHGAGSALEAKKKYGAIQGIGKGLQGNSYAIPTKDYQLNPLPLYIIYKYIHEFIEFARVNPDKRFHVVKIGCGLAGWQEHQIAPEFKDSPSNVILPDGWREFKL